MEVIDTKSKQSEVGEREVARPLWTILVIVTCLLVLRPLMQQSVFFDGTIYASIARNLSEGIGSPWRLQFSKTLFSVFSEHPPLMMWLEAIGFWIFGDTIAVEKGFSFLTLIASGLILLKIWQVLHVDDPELRAAGPVALMMALVAGRVSWAFTNGMLENLLIVFTSVAVLCVVRAYCKVGARTSVSRGLVIIVAGLLVALALLTKGPVGLFPLAAPAIYWIAFRRPGVRLVVFDTFVMSAVVVAFFAVLWQFEGARDEIQRYLSIQLFPSLAGQRGSGSGHWSAVWTFLRLNAYPAIITLSILLYARRWGPTPASARDVKVSRLPIAVFLALVGFSASLPLLVSPRVSSFYFNPSLGYFASAFAVACIPAVMRALRGMDARVGIECPWGCSGYSRSAWYSSGSISVDSVGMPPQSPTHRRSRPWFAPHQTHARMRSRFAALLLRIGRSTPILSAFTKSASQGLTRAPVVTCLSMIVAPVMPLVTPTSL